MPKGIREAAPEVQMEYVDPINFLVPIQDPISYDWDLSIEADGGGLDTTLNQAEDPGLLRQQTPILTPSDIDLLDIQNPSDIELLDIQDLSDIEIQEDPEEENSSENL